MFTNRRSLCLMMLFFFKQVLAAETLEQVFAEALKKNQLILAAKADTEASEQQLSAAEGQYMPRLNVRSGYTQLSESPSAKTSFGSFAVSQAGSAQAEAIVSVPVFTSGRIEHNIDAAEAINLATQHNEVSTKLDIKRKVAEAFVTILRMQQKLIVEQSHVVKLKAHAKDAKNLYQQGVIARNDLLAADVELSNAEQQVIQADNQLNIAKARLNQLLNRNLTAKVELLEEFPEVGSGDLSTLYQQALKQRPELNVLAEQIRALEAQALSEKSNLLPQINVNAGYQYQENQYQQFEGMWMANVTLNWTLFDGSTSHLSKVKKHQALALKYQRDDLINAIYLQIHQAWLTIQETQKRIKVAKQTIAHADENLRVSSERYQNGLSSHTEVLDAEDLRITANHNFHNARYDAVMAKLNLRYALGIL